MQSFLLKDNIKIYFPLMGIIGELPLKRTSDNLSLREVIYARDAGSMSGLMPSVAVSDQKIEGSGVTVDCI